MPLVAKTEKSYLHQVAVAPGGNDEGQSFHIKPTLQAMHSRPLQRNTRGSPSRPVWLPTPTLANAVFFYGVIEFGACDVVPTSRATVMPNKVGVCVMNVRQLQRKDDRAILETPTFLVSTPYGSPLPSYFSPLPAALPLSRGLQLGCLVRCDRPVARATVPQEFGTVSFPSDVAL